MIDDNESKASLSNKARQHKQRMQLRKAIVDKKVASKSDKALSGQGM